jgi:hypothetical protein
MNRPRYGEILITARQGENMHISLRNYQFSEGFKDDVRGSSVYGVNEEQLGKIDDLIFDEKTGSIKYAVIDSGGWLQSRRFLLPPEQLQQSHQHDGDFEASYTKQQIERFPAFHEEIFTFQERFDEYERSYLDVYAPTSAGIPGREVPSQSPLSPRFLKFQEEMARNREQSTTTEIGASSQKPERKAG